MTEGAIPQIRGGGGPKVVSALGLKTHFIQTMEAFATKTLPSAQKVEMSSNLSLVFVLYSRFMSTYSIPRGENERKAPQLTLQALERHLERATEQLRFKMDASEYKTYLLGLLFLKKVSDQFGERYSRVLTYWRVHQKSQEEAREYAEDPLSYPGEIFVPKAARWSEVGARVETRTDVATILNAALQLLGQGNESLSDMLTHIDFERRVGKSPLLNQTLRDLVRQFSELYLAGDGFVPDILGTAYDRLTRDYSSSGGRGDGEFYTPPEVAHLLARLLKPGEGARVYDPCVGSGSLLLESARYVREMGGDTDRVTFYGQDIHAATAVLCTMNMLLHGISTAHIASEDTLLHPKHIETDGTLTRFDYILTNPPFGLSSTKVGMEFMERFPHATQNGKQGEYMFVQHMLAVLQPGGMIATVLPLGVLFREGTERAIRHWLVHVLDALEAVISLPSGLFYGTGIPTCILVLRGPGGKSADRKGKVLFVSAEDEYGARRGQNLLRPEDIEKIASCFESFREVPNYARVVGEEEIAENLWNLNVRRYIEPVPAPITDIRGIWLGGVPKTEVAARQEQFDGLGLHIAAVLTERDEKYYRFAPDVSERYQIRTVVTGHPGVQAKTARLDEVVRNWWQAEGRCVLEMGTRRARTEIRTHLKMTFTHALLPEGTLNELHAASIFARWWDAHRDDLLHLTAVGISQLVDGWASSLSWVGEAVDDAQLVTFLLPTEVGQIRKTQECILELERPVKEWEMEQDEMEEWEDPGMRGEQDTRDNRARELQQRLNAIKSTIKERGQRDKTSTCTKQQSLAVGARTDDALPDDVISQLNAQRALYELALAPYLEHKARLVKARKLLKSQREALLPLVQQKVYSLSLQEKENIVLNVLGADLCEHLHSVLAGRREELIDAIERWFDTYAEGIVQLQAKSEAADRHLHELLSGLGYF